MLFRSAPDDDGNRTDDTVTLTAYTGTVGDREEVASESITVADVNALPAVEAKVVDEDGDALDPQPEDVEEGETIYVQLIVIDEDGDPAEAEEDLTITLSQTGTAGPRDYHLPARSITISEGSTQSDAFELAVLEDDDTGSERLVFHANVEGDSDVGPGTRTSLNVLSLTITDTTVPNITPRSDSHVQDVVDAAIRRAAGANDRWEPGDSWASIKLEELFVLPDFGFTVTAGVASSDQAIIEAEVVVGDAIFGAEDEVVLRPVAPGTADITVTAQVQPASSVVGTQLNANTAEVTFEGIKVLEKEAPSRRGQIINMEFTGGGEVKNIGGVSRHHVEEGAIGLQLAVTVRWTHAELSEIYGAGTTAPPAVIFVQLYSNLADTRNWLSPIDGEQDVHFPDGGRVQDGRYWGSVSVELPAKPRAVPNSIVHTSDATGLLDILILEDEREAENEVFRIEAYRSEDVDLSRVDQVNVTLPPVVIEDNDEQKVMIQPKGPSTVYENDDETVTVTVTADPARRDLPLDVRLDMQDLSGVTVSAAEISLSDASLTLNAAGDGSAAGNKADVTVHLPASDGNRVDDSYQLEASVNVYSLASGGFDTIPVASHEITVVDVHKIPLITMVNPTMGEVAEGGTLEIGRAHV